MSAPLKSLSPSYISSLEVDYLPPLTRVASVCPTITVQPQSEAIYSCANAQFSILATDAITYQWQMFSVLSVDWFNLVDGENASGVHTSTLTLMNISSGATGVDIRLRCVVGSGSCDVISDEAVLTVNPIIPSADLECLSTEYDYTDLTAALANNIFPDSHDIVNASLSVQPDGSASGTGTWEKPDSALTTAGCDVGTWDGVTFVALYSIGAFGGSPGSYPLTGTGVAVQDVFATSNYTLRKRIGTGTTGITNTDLGSFPPTTSPGTNCRSENYNRLFGSIVVRRTVQCRALCGNLVSGHNYQIVFHFIDSLGGASGTSINMVATGISQYSDYVNVPDAQGEIWYEAVSVDITDLDAGSCGGGPPPPPLL